MNNQLEGVHWDDIKSKSEIELANFASDPVSSIVSFSPQQLYNPNILNKKELTALKKEIQKEIDDALKALRDPTLNSVTRYFIEFGKESSIENKKIITQKLEFFNKKSELPDIPKAKAFPVDQLLDFNRGQFTDCIFHATGKQNTPSLHLDKRRNKAHCFSCGKDADSIDVYMKLHNVTLSEAVKKLS